MSRKQRLELTWIGKDERPRVEPRILLEDSARSYRAAGRSPDDDIFENRLIFGDNLLALKALESEFAGKVDCACLDPPYNTGAAFEHYDDGVEHSVWLSLMRDRLELVRNLLSDQGSCWIVIDDSEAHYLKVLCDEIFGRDNFVTAVIWEKADSPRNSARQFSTDHDYILVYSKHPDWVPRRLPRTEEANSIYQNPDDDPRGPWLPGDPYANKPYSKGQYSLTGPTGRVFSPPPGRFWRISEAKLRALDADGRIWWGPTKNARPSIKKYLSEVSDLVARTLWTKEQVGSNRTSKNEMRQLFPGTSTFETPKPEKLIERILRIATEPGDLVLDSFAGSGTTGAVAHKMRRQWIMIEQGEHAHSLIIPRMKKIVDGSDPGGVTEAVEWSGGGGFRYFRLAPSLIERDDWGNEVISSKYNPAMLAEAMCKHMGFTYAPDPDHFWMHGRSTERDFIYVTTAALTHEQLKKISDLVGPERTLLVCCRAFQKEYVSKLDNLTVRKIPHAILAKCEWGKDDYSMGLTESAGPPAENDAEPEAPAAKTEPAKPRKRKRPAKASNTPSLFDEEGKP